MGLPASHVCKTSSMHISRWPVNNSIINPAQNHPHHSHSWMDCTESERERCCAIKRVDQPVKINLRPQLCAKRLCVWMCVCRREGCALKLACYFLVEISALPNANFANGKSKLRQNVAQSERNREGMVFESNSDFFTRSSQKLYPVGRSLSPHCSLASANEHFDLQKC